MDAIDKINITTKLLAIKVTVLICTFTTYHYPVKDSVDAVEEMLKKQEDFEKMLAGQEEKFHMLIRETKVKKNFVLL